MALCSTAVLLGTALLLLAPGGTQALGGPTGEDADVEQDLVKDILLGRRAVEPPEEGEWAEDAGARSPRVQVGPEEDRDHLYHPVVEAEAEAEEPADLGTPLALSVEVQNGPEKDRDHLYHG